MSRYRTAGHFFAAVCGLGDGVHGDGRRPRRPSRGAVRRRALRRRRRAAVCRRSRLRRTSAPGLGTTMSTCSSAVRSLSEPITFLFAGQRYVTGGVAAVLLGLVPVVTPRAHASRLHRRGFTAATALGVALGFVGVVVIADPDPRTSRTASSVCRSCSRPRSCSLSPRSSPTADRRRCRSSPRRRG